MGEAKRRGTYEERKAMAIAKKQKEAEQVKEVYKPVKVHGSSARILLATTLAAILATNHSTVLIGKRHSSISRKK